MKLVLQVMAWMIACGLAFPALAAVSESQPNASAHWSFQAIQRPAIPAVNAVAWPRNAIDHFILARLERENLTPSPEADRRTLIRRLALDLLGLPPTSEQVRDFVSDTRSDAYEQWVDRLLASPHFGERWGRHWLDLARYADSDGYEKDSPRPYAYLYRDWVIDAINRDLPFDQFTFEQLAGDLLPGATEDQRIATGFHRNTLTNKEGGVDQEEFRCKAVVDRVNTTGTVWLGLTLACAECHNHKYDPISQREYYEFFAFFNNASERELPAPRPQELAQYRKDHKLWQTEHDALIARQNAYLNDSMAKNQAIWEKSFQSPKEHWVVLKPIEANSKEGAELKVQADGSVLVSGKTPAKDTYVIDVAAELSGVNGFRLEILNDPASDNGPGRGKNGNFVLNEFSVSVLEPAATGSSASTERLEVIPLLSAQANYSQTDWPVAGAIDGDPKTGWAIGSEVDRRHVAVFETKTPLTPPPGATLQFRLDQDYGTQHTIGQFRLSATSSSRPLSVDVMPDDIAEILRQPASSRCERQSKELASYYRDEADEEARRLRREIKAHAVKEPKFPETKAQVLVENREPRKTYVHVRGDFLRHGEEVKPGTLAVLPPLRPAQSPPNRLELARWLMSPDNPLPARVTVNRIWLHLFGRGLVATDDDFGTRGEAPSHPELLDWLATEFRALGWSRKSLIKEIVMSAAYRQSSDPQPVLAQKDPTNVLLARQNRVRLEAETVRDIFLAVSGLFNPELGGPSIRPPLPADIAALGYANSVKWKEDTGAGQYRRGLYIFFQRTVPYPMLMAFDAPDSNVTCTRRVRSNTPLQALTLLNDPVFFECAQALGGRLASLPEKDTAARIRRAFEICLARQPDTVELERLEKLQVDCLALMEAQPEAAAQIAPEKLAGSQTHTAAWIMLARTILNLDEFITRQ